MLRRPEHPLPYKIGEYLNERIPEGELLMFEESGHSLFWEEPEKFNREISRFAG